MIYEPVLFHIHLPAVTQAGGVLDNGQPVVEVGTACVLRDAVVVEVPASMGDMTKP